MSRSSLEDRISDVISGAVHELANLIREDLVGMLGTSSNGGAKRGAAKASAPVRGKLGRGKGTRKRLDDATVARVFKVIEDNPGLRSEEIYKKLPLQPDVAKKALARLRADQKVKTKGNKRATTYAPA